MREIRTLAHHARQTVKCQVRELRRCHPGGCRHELLGEECGRNDPRRCERSHRRRQGLRRPVVRTPRGAGVAHHVRVREGHRPRRRRVHQPRVSLIARARHATLNGDRKQPRGSLGGRLHRPADSRFALRIRMPALMCTVRITRTPRTAVRQPTVCCWPTANTAIAVGSDANGQCAIANRSQQVPLFTVGPRPERTFLDETSLYCWLSSSADLSGRERPEKCHNLLFQRTFPPNWPLTSRMVR